MSIKKQFEQIKAEQKKQEELQKRKEEAARADEEIIWQESQRTLAKVLKELDINKYLVEIRDNFWKLGRIYVGPIERAYGSATFTSRLTASWEIFIRAHSEYGPGDYQEWVNDDTLEVGESLSITVSAFKDRTSIKIERESVTNYHHYRNSEPKQFDYYGLADKQKLEEFLVQDCLANENFFPYSKIKEEEAKEIPKGLKRK